MYFRNFLLIIIVFFDILINGNCLKEYEKLEIKDNPSIKLKDLPDEFSLNAFKIIDEFIKKTGHLEYECAIYFDYLTGQILKCSMGNINEVSIVFRDGEFENNHVASIHNHPKSVFGPPSGKNFGIFLRDFEDYELIVASDELWILKAKCVSEKLMMEFNVASIELFKSALDQANMLYSDKKRVNKVCDMIYGAFLLKYINDKNINHIQLVKRSYDHDC